MDSRDRHTIIQLDEIPCRRLPWIASIVGSMALMAICAYVVAPTTMHLVVPVTSSTATGLADKIVIPGQSLRSQTMRPSQVALPSVDTEEITFTASEPQLFFSQAAAMFGSFLMAMGATMAFVHQMARPKPETMALLSVTGTPDGVEDGDVLGEIFTFNNLRAAPGSRHRKKRKGRGHAAGQGATCGFGTRGQKSRKGPSVRPGFEGGQNPLWRRTPKLRGRPLGPGHKRKEYLMVSLLRLVDAEEGSTLQFDDRSGAKPVLFKVGGLKPSESATLPKNLTVRAHAFTASARKAIEEAGGKCIVIDKYSRELDADGKVVQAEAVVAMAVVSGEIVSYKDEDYETDMYITDEDELSDPEDRPDIAMLATTAVRSAKVGKYKDPAPSSSKMSPKKKAIMDQVHESLKGAFVVFGFSMSGYTMAQITKLRNSMPAGVKIQVVKNTLFRQAARGTGFEALDPITIGSKAWVFIPEESFQEAIKAYGAFLKETKRQDTNPILGGAMEETLLDEKQVVALSDMPTKQELIAQIARLIKNIPTKVAFAVKATPRKLARAIKLATVGDETKEEASAEA